MGLGHSIYGDMLGTGNVGAKCLRGGRREGGRHYRHYGFSGRKVRVGGLRHSVGDGLDLTRGADVTVVTRYVYRRRARPLCSRQLFRFTTVPVARDDISSSPSASYKCLVSLVCVLHLWSTHIIFGENLDRMRKKRYTLVQRPFFERPF